VWRTIRKKKIAERRLAAADERSDPQTEPGTDAERKRANELSIPASDLHGELEAAAKLAVPLDEPTVEKERTRAGHRPHKGVPRWSQ
jgi:hypothetical protein